MKKLFTFAAAVLASVSLWADYNPPTSAVYTVGDAETLGTKWQNKSQTQNYFEVGDAVIFSPFVAYASSGDAPNQSWVGHVGGSSAVVTWGAQDIFKGSAAWFSPESDARQASVRSSRYYKFNVTNCVDVHALVKSGSSSSEITLAAYEIADSDVSEEVAKSATYLATVEGVLSIEGLDAKKVYQIKVISNDNTNSGFFEIAFVQPSAVSYTVTYKANNDTEEADIVAENAKKIAACTFTAPANHLFDGWNTKADGTGNKYAVGDKVEEDLTLYAQWKEINTCASLYPAAEGPAAAKYELVELTSESFGGEIIFVDAKDDTKFADSFSYTAYGLQMNKGGKDSVRVVLDHYMVAGSTIEIKVIVGSLADAKARGFKVQNSSKTTVLDATWVGKATEEATPITEKTFEYTVVDGDGLAGNNVFLIARSNSAILNYVLVSGCGSAVPETPTAIDNLNDNTKAVKTIENGQLIIIKNGVRYNAQGAVVK